MLRDFLKRNNDIRYAFFPQLEDWQKNKVIIRFELDDRRQYELTNILKGYLPYYIDLKRHCLFYVVLPHIYD